MMLKKMIRPKMTVVRGRQETRQCFHSRTPWLENKKLDALGCPRRIWLSKSTIVRLVFVQSVQIVSVVSFKEQRGAGKAGREVDEADELGDLHVG